LTRGPFRRAVDDGALFRVIATGIPGSAMPGALASHSTEDVWQLVRYVRSLARTTVAPATAGNPVLGRQLFDARGGCSACHSVDGRATPSGPGLGDIGRPLPAAATAKLLRESVTNADAFATVRSDESWNAILQASSR
jgi:mono/diheme cytochrome c family protein